MKKNLLVVFFVISCSFILFAINGVETVGIDQLFVVKEVAVQKDKNKGGKKVKASSSTCTPFALPFEEDFSRNSVSKDCWTIYDLNQNATATMYKWNIKEFDYSVTFYSKNIKEDDWLITPPLMSSGKYVLLEFNLVRSSIDLDLQDIDIYMSTKGNDPGDFLSLVDKVTPKRISVSEDRKVSFFVPKGEFFLGLYVKNGGELRIRDLKISELDCVEPLEINVSGIRHNQVVIDWKDKNNSSWDYVVQEKNVNYPNNSYTSTKLKSNTITNDVIGNILKANTEYEFFIRSECANGKNSQWIGPIDFKTACEPISSFPFIESFEKTSPSLSCWQLKEGDIDQLEWGIKGGGYNDSFSVYLGNSNLIDRKALISPVFNFGQVGGSYELSFYFKSKEDNPYKLYMSTNGIDYIEVVGVIKNTSKGIYRKETYFLKKMSGLVNFAWMIDKQVLKPDLYIDEIKIDKVDCFGISINDINVDNVTSFNAKIGWIDTENQNWEYYVQPSGGLMSKGLNGTLVNQKSIIVDQENITGGKLKPNTMYDFYVRTMCKDGLLGEWNGPVKFKTYCDEVPLPFWEGFNAGSTTLDCWRYGDLITGDFKSLQLYDADKFEGTHSISYLGYPNNSHLISPSFRLESNKIYRLKYHYRNYNEVGYGHRSTVKHTVRLSTTGTEASAFTKVLQENNKLASLGWEQKTIVFTGVEGLVNIGWFIESSSLNLLRFDNVFFEEVQCSEPTDLIVEDVRSNVFNIIWNDDIATKWEYVVQSKGSGIPQTNGVATNLKKMEVTKDIKGASITPFTEYEFYVRSNCGGKKYSDWIGPYTFRTACEAINIPYWEGFNEEDSELIPCWSVSGSIFNPGSLSQKEFFWQRQNNYFNTNSNNYNTASYEGSGFLFYNYLIDNIKKEEDNWLITPTFNFDKGKIYRLKYHYSIDDWYYHGKKVYQIDFEVKGSNSGVLPESFKTEIVKRKLYTLSKKEYLLYNEFGYRNYSYWYENNYKLKKAFIKDLSGEVNLAWHIITGKDVYSEFLKLDNIFIEEVKNCPEPNELLVDEVKFDEVVISWEDDFEGNGWEYFVHEETDNPKKIKGILTNGKSNKIKSDYLGNKLKQNTSYKVYARTRCLNGGYSEWSEPLLFTTACGVYSVPFVEGFNKTNTNLDCWSAYDLEGTLGELSPYWEQTSLDYSEGDQSLLFINTLKFNIENENRKFYLISPTIKLDIGKYVLKYSYRNTNEDDILNEHQVLLSTSGKQKDDFKTVLVSPINDKTNNFTEVVRFFDITSNVEANIAWISNTINTDKSFFYLDDVKLEKVETCPEPYNIRMTSTTSNSIAIEWDQVGNVLSWDVFVFDRGKDYTGVPINIVNVTGLPKATVTGLIPGKNYNFYVKANCSDGQSVSNWSSAFTYGTRNLINDECINAINIPINLGKNYDCAKTVEGSLYGATKTQQPLPPNCNWEMKSDVWFEFTALTTEHLLSLVDFENKSSKSKGVSIALYDKPCNRINSDVVECFNLDIINSIFLLKDLIPNQKYYLRISTEENRSEILFSLCLSTPKYLHVDGSQKNEELINKVLLNSDCGLISNITSKTGTDYGFDNGIGHFAVNSPYFSFKEGVMLATNGVQYAKGPSSQFEGIRTHVWLGDEDLKNLFKKNVVENIGNISNSSVLEFDFIPISNEISFDFLIASNDYFGGMEDYPFYYTLQLDLIGFFLKDLTTNEIKNIAVIPETTNPIFIKTIPIKGLNENYFDNLFIDRAKINLLNYFDPYGYSIDFEAFLPKEWNSVNYRGITKPMRAKSTVVPGRKYHLKLAIGNYGIANHSAVFFNKGSLDITSFSLGDDLLIETNTALCANETHTIESHLSDDKTKVDIKWYKDDEELIGEHEPNLIVKEAGVYKIVAKFLEYDCESKGELKVEVYPLISSIVKQPKDISACKNTIQPTGIDLTPAVDAMFENTGLSDYDYIITYYEDVNGTKQIKDPKNYMTDQRENKKIYLFFKDPNTSCIERFEFNLSFVEGEKPKARETVNVCNSYTLPKVEANQVYYTESGGKGVRYKEGDVLGIGKYDMYVLQDNGNNCYEEVMFKIEVGKTPELQIIEDVVLSCKLYAIPVAWPHNKFYIEKDGKREEVITGTSIVKNNTKVYVVATSPNGACVDETSFVVRYEDCPIPKGISPNGDGMNDTFDLTLHGVTSVKIFNRLGTEVYSFAGHYTDQWDGKDKKGKALPSGTYYYVIQSFDKARTGWVEISK